MNWPAGSNNSGLQSEYLRRVALEWSCRIRKLSEFRLLGCGLIFWFDRESGDILRSTYKIKCVVTLFFLQEEYFCVQYHNVFIQNQLNVPVNGHANNDEDTSSKESICNQILDMRPVKCGCVNWCSLLNLATCKSIIEINCVF